MIQAVADEDERGELGMHYTSVPNILKVLNPLFLNSLRQQLDAAGGNARKLGNLRKRLAAIRVFDPACGSGNFLVIAYLMMREIEHEIVQRTGDDPTSVIPLSNFYGIEIKSFAAEIARLSLLIAEFQADVRYISQQRACEMVLPLDQTGQIKQGNALRMDWLEVCPPTAMTVLAEHDLAGPTGRLALEENELGESAESETYICGNPPYQGSVNQSAEQKNDMAHVFSREGIKYKDLDYVAAWLLLASRYIAAVSAESAFVSTNSVCQGEQVAMLWPLIFRNGANIAFAHRSFIWRNNAANNAGVTCIVVGLSTSHRGLRTIYEGDTQRDVAAIGPYLTASPPIVVTKRSEPISGLPAMVGGNQPTDGGYFSLDASELSALRSANPGIDRFIKRFAGSYEFINGVQRWCIWIEESAKSLALAYPEIARRVDAVRALRAAGRSKQSVDASTRPHRFVYAPHRDGVAIQVPKVSSERRPYLPCSVVDSGTVVSDLSRVIYDAPIWAMALIASRLHLVWIATVCGKLKTDYRYSNTLGWNTFPVPPLTEANRAVLTARAEEILLAREAHFPATIAELYDPDKMPEDVRRVHEANDETLERIYIGRKFRNDTERLEKLFEMYVKMAAERTKPVKRGRKLMDSGLFRHNEATNDHEVGA
jgi:hypothetical protein